QPRVAFDTNSDKVMVMYTKTDYNTPDVSFDQSDVTKIGDFLYNSYSLIAYRIYVDGNWQTTYYDDETQYLRYEENNGTGSLNGQRFISFTLPGVADSPKITETAVTSYNGLTLYAYTLDVDQNPLTKDDTEIFMMIYNYAERSISYPIRITDNLTPDENPQIARYGDTSYLYWNNDGRIAYLNISGIVKYGLSQTSTDGKYYYVIDEAYKQPVYATTAKNYDAASSYQVTVGQDGNMYLVWSEYKQYAPDTDHPSERISERQLYAAMYDAKYKEAAEPDSDGNIVYTGAWGDKYQLTRTSGEYNNEQAIAVDGNGQIVVVNRRYTIVNDEINGGTKESDTSSLIARAFVPASSLEIGDADISIYPEFPRAGESVSITATAHNQGFKPSDQVTFKFSLINEENETSIGENIVQDVHLVAGGTTTAYANLNLPEEMSNAKIKVMAWEGDMENSAVSREIAINSGEKLSIENEYAHMIHRNKLLVTGRLLNLGNQDASGVTLVLEKTDPRATVQALMVDGSDMPKPLVLKEITYDRLAAGAAVEINETVDIPDENYNEAEPFELTIKARQKIDAVDTTVAAKHLNIEKPQTEDTTVQGISILGAQDETPSITITAGTSKNLNARLIPLAAANAHTMLYQSSNPDIASVDQSGLITGLTAGTAVISIMSIKSEPAYLSGLDDKIYTADGTAVQFDNTGRVQNQSSSTVNSDCDYTQTVTIQVTGQSSGSGPSSHIPTVVQPVTQPGTAVDNDGATVQVKAVISLTGSLTLATVNPESISAALDELKQATGTQNRVLNIQIDSAAGTDNQINLPKESVAAMAESGVQVQITSSTASVRLDSMTMRFINEAADGDVTLQVNRVPPETLSPGARKTLGDRPAIDIAMKSGDKVITGFGGSSLIVTIPYEIRDGEDVNAIVVYYLDDSGTLTMVKASNYDSQSKTVTFATQHLSKYAVAYHRIPFDDTVGHWAEDAIDYLVSREVVSGTGDNRFVPDQDVTRAEFVKMLLESLDGIDPGEADQASFDDVEPGAWYAPSINWGSSREIIAGYSDGRFGPNDRVSREQMAVILVSLAKAGKQELNQVNTEQSFADSDQISTWAKAAVTTVQTAGIINGKPGKLFDPQGNTTRAEAATVIADMMKKHLQ
ncbi:MAG: S-layer homology domain-containing protein, partial [Syntrophomonas sp.]